MSDLSIVEFGVYGLIAYSTLLFIISSIVKDIPTTRSLSLSRIVFTIPGMICMGVIASSGINILLDSKVTNTLTYNSTKFLLTNSTAFQPTHMYILQNPIWTMVHTGFFIILLYFVISQVMFLMTKQE